MVDQWLFIWSIFSTWQADNHRHMFRLSDSKMNLEFPSGQPLVSSPAPNSFTNWGLNRFFSVFVDKIFRCILIKISLKFDFKGPYDPQRFSQHSMILICYVVLVQVMAWHQMTRGVRIFCVEFQRYIWKSTNSLPIHRKIRLLYNIEILRALRFKSSYAFLKCAPVHWCIWASSAPFWWILLSNNNLFIDSSHAIR